jgi:ammonium transporter, Amt family
VSPTSALLIGAIAALPSYYAILYRAKTRVDDSLDVFSAHGLGGITGILMVGVFSQSAWSGLKDCDGMAFGNPTQLGKQGVAALVVAVFSGVMTFGLLKLLGAIMPLRTATTEEGRGMDVVLHGEEAYTSGEGAVLLLEHEVAAPVHAGKLPVGVHS